MSHKTFAGGENSSLRRVLIVSPNFPPINAADHQRIRTSLPYLAENGWEAVILTVRPRFVEATEDPFLAQTIPTGAAVHCASALPVSWTRPFGLGSLALRALPFLWWTGSRLIRTGNFDLIYFSTTMFPVMVLGPIWKRKFRVPYVVDFQDPWLSDYYDRPSAPPPPGGRLKHGFQSWIARTFEPRVMRDVSQTIVVSPAYSSMLRDRYEWLSSDSIAVLPFGAPEKDFELLPTLSVRQRVFDRRDGLTHWVYVGRGGGDMAGALRIVFRAVAANRRRNPEGWSKIRLHFAGTDYAPQGKGKETIMPIAAEFGITDLVSELTDRLPYFETLQALVDSDALLIIGSDSPAYSPSKLYPYVLARRPMLAVMHEDSPGATILRDCRAADVVTFDAELREIEDAKAAVNRLAESSGTPPDVAWERFSAFSAREMTAHQCRVFDKAIGVGAA